MDNQNNRFDGFICSHGNLTVFSCQNWSHSGVNYRVGAFIGPIYHEIIAFLVDKNFSQMGINTIDFWLKMYKNSF